MMFVCSAAEEAEALLAYMRSPSPAASTALQLRDLAVDTAVGAFSNDKHVRFVLVITLDIAVGIVGNFIYDAIQAAPNETCVVGYAVVDCATASSPLALEAQIRAAARSADDLPALP